MSKTVKNLMISEIRRRLGDARDMIVVDMSKVTAFDSNKWRNSLRKRNIRAVGVKNAVARKALSEVGITGLDAALKGPSTLLFGGEDAVALAKQIVDDLKTVPNLQIRGGALSGDTPLSAEQVEQLSKSPGRKELLSQLVGLILSPGARLGGALLGAGGRISGAVKAHSEREADAAPVA